MQLPPMPEQLLLVKPDVALTGSLPMRDRDRRSLEQPHGCVTAEAIPMIQIVRTMRPKCKKGQGVEHPLVTEKLRRHLAYVAQVSRHPQDLLLPFERGVQLVKERGVPAIQPGEHHLERKPP